MMNNFSCVCNAKKLHRLIFDGGNIIGTYHLDLCHSCFLTQNKKFLVEVNDL